MGLVAAVTAGCVLPFVPVPPRSIWPVVGISVCLHFSYKLALARAYKFGELGQAFPLARGFVPLFASIIAFVVLGEIPKNGQIVGILVVSAGLLWLTAESIRGGINHHLLIAALAAGLTVAGYATVDAYGTRLAGNWASFTAWLVVIDSGSFVLFMHAVQGRHLWNTLWCHRGRTLVSGLLGIGSFAVFLWALSRGTIGSVAALRESSVLFAAIFGIVFYGEQLSVHRLGAAALIVIGLMTITILR